MGKQSYQHLANNLLYDRAVIAGDAIVYGQGRGGYQGDAARVAAKVCQGIAESLTISLETAGFEPRRSFEERQAFVAEVGARRVAELEEIGALAPLSEASAAREAGGVVDG